MIALFLLHELIAWIMSLFQMNRSDVNRADGWPVYPLCRRIIAIPLSQLHDHVGLPLCAAKIIDAPKVQSAAVGIHGLNHVVSVNTVYKYGVHKFGTGHMGCAEDVTTVHGALQVI
jgi:hypothetical protein